MNVLACSAGARKGKACGRDKPVEYQQNGTWGRASALQCVTIPYSDRQQRRSHFQQAIALKGLSASLSEVGQGFSPASWVAETLASIFNMRV